MKKQLLPYKGNVGQFSKIRALNLNPKPERDQNFENSQGFLSSVFWGGGVLKLRVALGSQAGGPPPLPPPARLELRGLRDILGHLGP